MKETMTEFCKRFNEMEQCPICEGPKWITIECPCIEEQKQKELKTKDAQNDK